METVKTTFPQQQRPENALMSNYLYCLDFLASIKHELLDFPMQTRTEKLKH